MSEKSTEEIKVDSLRKPLEPVGDGVSDEQRATYAKLLTEYERIREMRDTQIEKEPHAVEAYNVELAVYRKARAEYNSRFADSVETIDMVREKLYRMSEEFEQYEKDHPDVECPAVPALEDIPDEPWEDFKNASKSLAGRFKRGASNSKRTPKRHFAPSAVCAV